MTERCDLAQLGVGTLVRHSGWSLVTSDWFPLSTLALPVSLHARAGIGA